MGGWQRLNSGVHFLLDGGISLTSHYDFDLVSFRGCRIPAVFRVRVLTFLAPKFPSSILNIGPQSPQVPAVQPPQTTIQPPISTIPCKPLNILANLMLKSFMFASQPTYASNRPRRSHFAFAPVTPFVATLTVSSQLTENPATLSPVFATLTRHVKPSPFVCHSYKKHPGVGVPRQIFPLSHSSTFSVDSAVSVPGVYPDRVGALNSPPPFCIASTIANSFTIRTYAKHTRNPFRIRTSKTRHLKPFRMNSGSVDILGTVSVLRGRQGGGVRVF